jgi:hypothetical protein
VQKTLPIANQYRMFKPPHDWGYLPVSQARVAWSPATIPRGR